MDHKHNLWGFVKAHWSTLDTVGSRVAQAGIPLAVAVFVAFPLIPGQWPALKWVKQYASPEWSENYDGLLTMASILFGFFFAMAVFVFQLRAERDILDPKHRVQTDNRAKPLVDELFTNCAYAVIVTGTVAAITLVVTLFPGLAAYGANAVLSALVVHIGLLSMMCVRRLGSAYRQVVNLRSFDNWKSATDRIPNSNEADK